MRFSGFFAIIAAAELFTTAATAALPVGPLQHDGPPTPEQLSLLVPITGSLPQTARATVQYRELGGTWREGHPLYRIRREYSRTPNVGAVIDAFAWPIIDLRPGTTYAVEVTVVEGSEREVLNATFTTRALPAEAGPSTVTLSAGASEATIEAAFAALGPGDVLEFEEGDYVVEDLRLSATGTASEPIYIRGRSRNGVRLVNAEGNVLRIDQARHVVLENMTLVGSNDDAVFSTGVRVEAGADVIDLTLRRLTLAGVNRGMLFNEEAESLLIYDNTLLGNNRWLSEFVDSNATWSDDGIRPSGAGAAVFNNTILGFGDSLAVANASGSNGITEAYGMHFYRNEVRNSGDDMIEADHGHRNLTFYDNRSHNSMTFLSLDPVYGGPLVAARNVAINTGRTPFKWNSPNSGQFVYSNTIVIGESRGARAGWQQPRNGAQESYAYRNNLMIYLGSGDYLLRMEAPGHRIIDWTHNGWYPDRRIQWEGLPGELEGFMSLAEAKAKLADTTPIFSGSTRRMLEDIIVEENPFETRILLGASYLDEVTGTYLPTLAARSGARKSGVALAGITDGFVGPRPDRGALIEGRPLVVYGDREGGLIAPRAPTDLAVEE